MPDKRKFAVLGTGFWSLYQIPDWFEVGGVYLLSFWNCTHSRSLNVSERFGNPRFE